MKKTIKLAVVAALALGATSAFATNGSNLIAMGAKARGMGGTSIGIAHGAESAVGNAALITSVKDTEISFGGTIFMPDVKNSNGLNLAPGNDYTGSATSAADMSVIPEVSIASKINENFYAGIGMWGTAGMGVDYREATATGQMNMVTNLQLMQFGVPLAYKINSFSVAITPILQYGSLDINYIPPSEFAGRPAYSLNKGAGVAQDLQFGYNLGLAYETSGITIGANYKSQIDMEYTGVLSRTVDLFSSTQTYSNDKLSTPEEIGIGISYKMDEHTIAFDYKRINWSDAEGYKDFEWNDQNVYAIGYAYETKTWTARLGYNYSKSPIKEQNVEFDVGGNETNFNTANLSHGVINTFNLLGFPGMVESHYTIGGSYNISDKTSVDVAYVYAKEATEIFTNFAGQDMTVKHSQDSFSVAVNYNF